MAQKEYSVSQNVNLDGQTQTRSFTFYGEQTDLEAFIAHLEGVVKVKEVILEQGSNATPVTSANFLKSVSMYPASDVNVAPAYIRSYDRRALILKNTVGIDELKSTLGAITPFVGNATAKPSSISASFSEKVVTV